MPTSRSNLKRRTPGNGGLDDLLVRIFDRTINHRFGVNDRRAVRRACARYVRSARVLTYCGEYEQQLALHWTHRGLISRRSWTMARHLFERATRIDPEYARAWEGLASILDMNADYAAAEHAARRAVRYGDDPCSVALLARILSQRGKLAEAKRLARQILNSQSTFAATIAKDVLRGDWKPLD